MISAPSTRTNTSTKIITSTVRIFVIDSLSQVNMMKKRLYTVTGSGDEVLRWEENGVTMHVPAGVVKPGTYCDIAVIPIMEGKFVFPDNHTPVSAIYAIGASCTLLKPIKIELQHCVDVTEENKGRMRFAEAKHDDVNPPYKFQTCEDGVFPAGSQYGSLECYSFTLYTILMSIAGWFTGRSSTRYKAQLFYTKSTVVLNKWTVRFAVTKDMNYHIGVNV